MAADSSASVLFSVRLKTVTQEVHTIVSKAKIVGEIVSKRITPEKYATYLARLYHMYGVMEDAVISNKDNPFVKHVFFEELNRMPGIEADMAHFLGNDWKDNEVVKDAFEATAEWREHIKKIANDCPEKLVAHMYVRYLGDLAGGQIFKGKLMGLKKDEEGGDPEAGVKSYVFDKVANPRELVTRFKAGLDKMIVEGDAKKTETFQQELIDECLYSYELTREILAQLEDSA